jgi:hypothetical protein
MRSIYANIRCALAVGPIVVATFGWPARSMGQEPVASDAAPAAFRSVLADVQGPPGALRDRGIARLGAEEEWEPYLRAALNATAEQGNRDALRRALIANQDRLFAWNLERAKVWAKELRFDYLTDLAAATDDADRAAAIGEHVIEMQRVVHDKYKALPLAWPGGRPPPPAWTFVQFPDYSTWSGREGFRRLSGDRVEVPKEQAGRPTFIHGRSGVVARPRGGLWISLSSTQLSEALGAEYPMGWSYSVMCTNSSARLTEGSISLFVCDGDVELSHPRNSQATFYGCVIIANGNVTGANERLQHSTFVYAAGDYSGKEVRTDFSVSIVAGGTIDPLPAADHPQRKQFREGVKENPLGIRFVSPADVGVELAVKKAVVRLGSLTKDSPLRGAGLEVGDRVFQLNGVHVKSTADFRRQLRESLLWGTGLFEIKRGDQTFLRLVKFAEPPKK